MIIHKRYYTEVIEAQNLIVQIVNSNDIFEFIKEQNDTDYQLRCTGHRAIADQINKIAHSKKIYYH